MWLVGWGQAGAEAGEQSDPSLEADAEELLWDWGQPGLHSGILPWENFRQTNKQTESSKRGSETSTKKVQISKSKAANLAMAWSMLFPSSGKAGSLGFFTKHLVLLPGLDGSNTPWQFWVVRQWLKAVFILGRWLKILEKLLEILSWRVLRLKAIRVRYGAVEVLHEEACGC